MADMITTLRARLVWYACKATGHNEMGRGAIAKLLECQPAEADAVATAVIAVLPVKCSWDGERLKLPRKKGPTRKHAREVFVHWQNVMGKSTSKFTRDRESIILARLREGFSVEDLKLAIDGCALDKFYMGENDRGKPFNDLKHICKNGAKVEEFMALASPHREQGTKTISDDDIADAIYSGDAEQAIAVLQRLSHQDKAKWLEAAAAALGLDMDTLRRRIGA